MKRIVKSSHYKNHEYFPTSKEQYFYITVNKIDYVLNKDVFTFVENNLNYVIVNEIKILLIFR